MNELLGQVSGGGLLLMKGLETDLTPRVETATTRTDSTVIEPFSNPNWRMIFTPSRVAIEMTAGELLNERLDPLSRLCREKITGPE